MAFGEGYGSIRDDNNPENKYICLVKPAIDREGVMLLYYLIGYTHGENKYFN